MLREVEAEAEVASMVSLYSPQMVVAQFDEELVVHESTDKDEMVVVAVQVGLLEPAEVGVEVAWLGVGVGGVEWKDVVGKEAEQVMEDSDKRVEEPILAGKMDEEPMQGRVDTEAVAVEVARRGLVGTESVDVAGEASV